MFDTLFLSLAKSKWTWISILVIIAGIWVYSLYSTNRKLEAERRQLQQNAAFVADSLKNAKAVNQTLSVRVGDLQIDSAEWQHRYAAIMTKYQIALDTIRVLRGRGYVIVQGDSVGIVRFDTTQGFATLQCTTWVNIKQQTSWFAFTLSFSEIDTKSTLFYDESDKLWKINTVALTAGVKLRGLSTLDEDTYRKISGITAVVPKMPSTFGVGGLVTYDRIYGGIIFAPSRWQFSLHYKIFEKNLVQNEGWTDKIMLGAHYFIW